MVRKYEDKPGTCETICRVNDERVTRVVSECSMFEDIESQKEARDSFCDSFKRFIPEGLGDPLEIQEDTPCCCESEEEPVQLSATAETDPELPQAAKVPTPERVNVENPENTAEAPQADVETYPEVPEADKDPEVPQEEEKTPAKKVTNKVTAKKAAKKAAAK